jgi:hypothetical protein
MGMKIGAEAVGGGMAQGSSAPFVGRPHSRLGWWAFGLGVAYFFMFFINQAVFMNLPEQVGWRQTLLPFYGIFMLLCGLAGGIVALIALLRNRERSWMVLLPLLPAAMVLLLVLGEFLIPH